MGSRMRENGILKNVEKDRDSFADLFLILSEEEFMEYFFFGNLYSKF